MPDPDAYAPVIIPDMRRDRAQTVVSGDAAAGFHAYLAWLEVNLVVENDDIGVAQLVEMSSLRDGTAGLVHIRAGKKEQDSLARERPFRRYALKAAAPRPDIMVLGNCIDGHEADVVPIAGIACPGIAEPHQQQHEP